MDRYYTILLDRGGRIPTRALRGSPEFEPAFNMASRLMADPPQPAIHRERLTPQELQELAQEPDFIAAAEIMSTRLLSPVAEAGSRNARPAAEGKHLELNRNISGPFPRHKAKLARGTVTAASQPM